MSENKKNILVTGGLGFVGSHLVDLLCESGDCSVTVIDNLVSDSASRSHMRDGVTYWIDDIRNLNSHKYMHIGKSGAHPGFDVIYHLAALARIQPSFKDPLTCLDIDIMGTAHVLEFARRLGSKVVYAGSSSAYAGPMLNPYAFAKFTGEQICELYSSVYGLSTVTARFFNVYGKRQPMTGPYATVVGIFEDLHAKGMPLTVTGDGEQRRDFTHVRDIVAGLHSLSSGTHGGEVYNLGTGRNHSINELAGLFGGEIQYLPQRPGEARITLADISATTQKTGWVPKTKLEDYISNFVQNG